METNVNGDKLWEAQIRVQCSLSAELYKHLDEDVFKKDSVDIGYLCEVVRKLRGLRSTGDCKNRSGEKTKTFEILLDERKKGRN
jgi:hypothetical protein